MKDLSQDYYCEKTEAVFLVERSVDKDSSIYSYPSYRRTSELTEQILAVKFKDDSEYGTKEAPLDVEKQLISV